MGDVKIDQATLEEQKEPLSEEQNEAIALAALNESNKPPVKEGEEPKEELKEEVNETPKEEKKPDEDKEESKEGTPKKETVLTDEDLLSTEDDKLSDDQKTKKVELVKKVEDEKVKIKTEEDELIAKKDEELSDEDKTKKAEIVKTREEADTQSAEAEVKAYAEEHKVTEDEARTDLESMAKIQEKYKDDPKQLAKANLHLQRLISKNQADTKATEEAKPITEVTIQAVEQCMRDGEILIGGKKIPMEETIEAYRDAYPKITEDLDDDKVLTLAAKDFKQSIDKDNMLAKGELKDQARVKRDTLYDSIPEADKALIPEIKPLIEKLTDSQIVSDNFNVDTYVKFVKGGKYDDDINKAKTEKKEFGAKEYKRGLQEAKILNGSRSPEGKAPSDKGTAGLTDAQKQRAEEKYDSPGITKEMAWKMHADDLKDEAKDKDDK